MAAPGPTAAFATAALDLATLPEGARLGRIYQQRFADPLGFGKLPSRFSDPRRRETERRFGVVYLGSSLKVCFLEAVLRDARDGAVGDWPLEERELDSRRYVQVRVREALDLIDLRADGPVRMGVPSDVAGAARQTLARRWSVAFHDHPVAPDGILYPSRLNGETNVAVYHRALHKLEVEGVTSLRQAPGLAGVLDALLVALV